MVVYIYCTKGKNYYTGKIIGTFEVAKVEKITDDNVSKFTKRSCLTEEELINYLGRVNSKGVYSLKGYAIHIKNFNPWFTPEALKHRPPQNMMRYYKSDVLMSIKPKYCELIKEGKKTIEIRRTVLKELEEIAEWIFLF